jgi:chromosome segregation ATPase
MDTGSLAETVRFNSREIERLRERSHDHGNLLQEHNGHFARMEDGLQDINQKLDAIHGSVKEDLGEIKLKQDQTNGRVTVLERRYAELRGIGLAFIATAPFAIFALQKLLS